jgi:hypothetical protein
VWGCQKETTLEDTLVSPNKPIPTIQTDEAKAWFERQMPSIGSSNANEDSTLILDQTIPVWDKAVNDFNREQREFLVTPFKNELLSSTSRSVSKLLLSRNQDGSLFGFYLVTIADSLYDQTTDGKYKTDNFTGFALYLDIQGKFKFGYKIENGFIKSGVLAKRKPKQGSLNVRSGDDCSCGPNIYIVGFYNPSIGGALNYSWSSFSSSSPPIPTGNSAGGDNSNSPRWNEPPTIFTQSELDATESKFFRNGLSSVYDVLVQNHLLLSQGIEFLGKRGWTAANKQALRNYVIGTNDLPLLEEQLALMTGIDEYYNICKNLNFNKAATMDKLKQYLNADFTAPEFATLFLNQGLFGQVDGFLNSNGFTAENKKTVKGFNFLMDVDDDFKAINQNRGNKSIKELIDEFGYPNLKSGTLIGMARKKGIDVDAVGVNNFVRLGRIQEDAVARSLGSYKNKSRYFQDPTGRRSDVEPDVLGNGFVSEWQIDPVSGVKYLNSWEGDLSTFIDSKFVSKSETLIKDYVTTNANNTPREQLSTMIDVLSQMRGGWIKSVRNNLMKPSDHGIAFLVIVTFKDVEIDPNLITQAQNANVIVYKRWLIHDPETDKVMVSTNYENKTPFVATRKPGAIDPPNFGEFVDIDWTKQ